MKSGNLNLLEPSGPHWACYGTALLSYCKWTRSAEQKHFSVTTTGCIRAVSHNWGTESLCSVRFLLHSLHFFMLGKMTRDAVTSCTQKVILLTAGLSDLMTSCEPIQNATWHLWPQHVTFPRCHPFVSVQGSKMQGYKILFVSNFSEFLGCIMTVKLYKYQNAHGHFLRPYVRPGLQMAQ
jgi:hypothetical protein